MTQIYTDEESNAKKLYSIIFDRVSVQTSYLSNNFAKYLF